MRAKLVTLVFYLSLDFQAASYSKYLGDENRQELLNLGALEPLLKQVLSEDKVVRRSATMCLGTMAQNG